jgi:hypothetical protein
MIGAVSATIESKVTVFHLPCAAGKRATSSTPSPDEPRDDRATDETKQAIALAPQMVRDRDHDNHVRRRSRSFVASPGEPAWHGCCMMRPRGETACTFH